MRRWSLFVVLVMMASVFALSVPFASDVRGATLFVGGGGPGNYTSIQAAIDAASPGDTAFVLSGTYYENVVLNKTISLVGESSDATVIDGGGAGTTIFLTASWTNITGFTITGGYYDFDPDETTAAGIVLITAHNCNVSANNVTGNANGITVEVSNNVTLAQNRFSLNHHRNRAIYLVESSNATITQNTMVGNGIYLYGGSILDSVSLEHWNTHTIDPSNTVNGEPVYYWKDLVGGTVPPDAGQIMLANCSHSVVEGLHLDNVSAGIQLGFSSNNTIANNTAVQNSVSLHLSHSSYNTILGNHVGSHIKLHESSYNNITRNNGSLALALSDHNSVTYNNFSGNDGYGIGMSMSRYNDFIGNELSWNKRGLSSYGGNHLNIIRNNFTGNSDYGIRLFNAGFSKIYHNSFKENNRQAYDSGFGNYWDDGYPSGGNFWSDYAGVDLCSGPAQNVCPDPDGIGDENHVIDSDSEDRNPLMAPIGAVEPSAPQFLRTSVGDSLVILLWDPPSDDGGGPITSYRVYRGEPPGEESLLTDVVEAPYHEDRTVTNGITYNYTVTARNGIGESPESNRVSATPATVPSAPLNLSAAAGNGYVNLAWQEPADDGGLPVVNYSVYRGLAEGGEDLLIALGDVLTYTDNVTNGLTYWYYVRAITAAGDGLASNEVNATPVNERPLCTISTPTPGQTVSGSITVNGTSQDDDGIVERVEVRLDDGPWTPASGSVSWSFSWNSTIVADGEHTIFARSFDGEDYSVERNVTFIVDNYVPPPSSGDSSIFQQVWFWAAVIIVVVVISLLLILLGRKKAREQK